MHDGLHVGARRVHGRVDHALAVRRAAARVDRAPSSANSMRSSSSTNAGLRERDSQNRSAIARIAHADVAERVDDAFVREDAIRRDEPRELARHCGPGLRGARRSATRQAKRARRRAFEHAPARAAVY